jgi:N-terminal acetyltransferase B complex non-catalytic subunit
MSLQKNFPRERKYYFWAIFFCHIVSVDSASSDMDRKLFGTLAYRMISKAVAEVPTNPVCGHYYGIFGQRKLMPGLNIDQ